MVSVTSCRRPIMLMALRFGPRHERALLWQKAEGACAWKISQSSGRHGPPRRHSRGSFALHEVRDIPTPSALKPTQRELRGREVYIYSGRLMPCQQPAPRIWADFKRVGASRPGHYYYERHILGRMAGSGPHEHRRPQPSKDGTWAISISRAPIRPVRTCPRSLSFRRQGRATRARKRASAPRMHRSRVVVPKTRRWTWSNMPA